jgi:hypothetical protein
MTSVKALAIIALLAGSTSLAVAQSGPATGGEPPVAGGAAGNPAVPPAPSVYGATNPTPSHHVTRHHHIYMSHHIYTSHHHVVKEQ